MGLTVLIVTTLACVAWSLWIRRVTWTCRWEVAATLNVALQGLAVLLMTPLASSTVGHWLHALTGMWNLEDYIGHDCYLVAASAVVYNALGRLHDDRALQVAFTRYVEIPATLCIPLLLAAFSFGAGASTYSADFFQLPTDGWLAAYWLLLCAVLVHLMIYGSRALWVLRRDPRSRRAADVHLLACGFGIAACAVRSVTAVVPALQTVEDGVLVWLFACLCGAGFALVSAQSWRAKTRWFSPAR